LYKAIGAPEMSGEDDFLAVLKQMQDYQPTTKDGKKVYALSAWTDWGIWPYMIMYPFSYGYGNKGDYASVSRETGEMESNLLKEDGVFWRGIAFYNRAYRMGIFDPEGFTMKWDQYRKKVANGEVLTSPNPNDTVNPSLTNELAAMVCLPGAFPYVNGVFPGESLIGYGNNGARAISASCKYPERAMQLLNYFDSDEGARLIMNGVKGVDWDVIDGKPQLIGEYLKAVQSGETAEYCKKTLIGVLSLQTTGSVLPADNYPVDLRNTPEVAAQSATPGLKDFAKYFDSSFEYPGQAYAKLYKEGKIKTTFGTPHLGMGLMGTPSDTTNQTLSKGTQLFAANVAKFIMAKDDATFEAEKKKFIEDLKAMGYEKAFAEILDLYEQGKQIADKFTK